VTAGAKLTQRIGVAFEYPVVFTRGVFDPANPALAGVLPPPAAPGRRRLAAYVDDGVLRHHPGLAGHLRAYLAARAPDVDLRVGPAAIPGGERAKDGLEGVGRIAAELLRAGLCRHSCVIAVGGGAVLDAVGFAASIVHRGLRLVRVATTVLSQNDSGVGVKTALNVGGVKNALGTFAPPFAVVNDVEFLRTLPDRDWRAGAAEAFKVAAIKDAAFFRFLCDRAEAIRDRDQAAMEALVRRCARLHLDHIRAGGDPFESGAARPLDFGHWAAHELESMSRYRIRHGEAVAAGIALDATYAWRRRWLSGAERDALCGGLRRCGLPLWYDEFDRRDRSGRRRIVQGLDKFREHLGGELCITLPRGIGRRFEVHEMDLRGIDAALDRLRREEMSVKSKR
jgi:3-dehydroquinate synthase